MPPNRKLAIMQPYIFPYIGYFQLINSVDRFVVYDDVTFIKQGWINRNNILLNGKPHMFTVPLKNASSFTLIRNIELNHNLYKSWKEKFLKSLIQSYKKAPNYEKVFELISGVLNTECNTISKLAANSIVSTCNYLNIPTEFVLTAAGYDNDGLKAKDRVIDICKREYACAYINPIGGMELYDKVDFEQNGLQLNFIKSMPLNYSQNTKEFVPWLSIIDIMMFNDKEQIGQFLNNYELL